VVSLPSCNLFVNQPEKYRQQVLPAGVLMLAIEAGTSLGWKSYVEPQIDGVGVDQFGASAPGETVMRQYGFSVENITQRAINILKS